MLYRIWVFFVLVFFPKSSPSTFQRKCPTEQSLVDGTSVKVKWTSQNFDDVVISEPPCINSNNELVTRVCRNGSWNPVSTPLCQKLLNSDQSTALHWHQNISSLDFYSKTTESTRLVLSFEEDRRRLLLVVYSPENIKQVDNEFLIFCFTNAAKIDLKQKSKIVFSKIVDDNQNTPNSLLVYEVKMEKYMGEYWCEAFTSTLSTIRSDKVIAFTRKKGNEYSLRIVINNICKICSCSNEKLFRCLANEMFEKIFQGFSPETRIMEIFSFDTYRDFLDVLVHVSTGKGYSVGQEFLQMSKRLNSASNLKVVYFRSSEFCLSENNSINGTQLNWPLTKIGFGAVPEEFCFMKNGTPVVRRCQGDFLYGAFWSNITGSCVENPPISQTTITLREMVNRNISADRVWDKIKNASLSVLDIYYLNVILGKIRDNDTLYALDFVNKLMNTDRKILEKSQTLLNLTDSTLESTDEILANFSLSSNLVYLNKKEKLLVHVTKPFQSNVSGLLLYGERQSPDISVVDFQRGDNFENVDKHNLHLAVYVPETILEDILNETASNASDIFIVTTIFYNDKLFVDDKYHSGSFVISVSIPGYGSYLQSPIPIIFESKSDPKMCGFWDIGKKSNWKKGEWSILGSNYLGKVQDDLHLCSFVHLTHFALLVMSDRKNIADEDDGVVTYNSEDYSDDSLEIITIVGCSFSAVGVLGIFLTAVVFKKWREKIGTKILINMSVGIFLEIVCIHLSEIKTMKTSENICKIIGMVLHYVVLSKFSWTLIYALLQYYRFVKVIGAIPKNLILKSVIAGWGIPLAIVFLVGLFTNQSYVSSSYQLCYPRGLLLYLTVLMPVCFIILANLVIFCLVMYNVTYKINVDTNKKLFRLRLYLALLLFSVLGIPWVFGILAELVSFSLLKIILFHIFCITATLQGFVLFLFYVVLNRETREYWARYFKTKISWYCK